MYENCKQHKQLVSYFVHEIIWLTLIDIEVTGCLQFKVFVKQYLLDYISQYLSKN